MSELVLFWNRTKPPPAPQELQSCRKTNLNTWEETWAGFFIFFFKWMKPLQVSNPDLWLKPREHECRDQQVGVKHAWWVPRYMPHRSQVIDGWKLHGVVAWVYNYKLYMYAHTHTLAWQPWGWAVRNTGSGDRYAGAGILDSPSTFWLCDYGELF